MSGVNDLTILEAEAILLTEVLDKMRSDGLIQGGLRVTDEGRRMAKELKRRGFSLSPERVKEILDVFLNAAQGVAVEEGTPYEASRDDVETRSDEYRS